MGFCFINRDIYFLLSFFVQIEPNFIVFLCFLQILMIEWQNLSCYSINHIHKRLYIEIEQSGRRILNLLYEMRLQWRSREVLRLLIGPCRTLVMKGGEGDIHQTLSVVLRRTRIVEIKISLKRSML